MDYNPNCTYYAPTSKYTSFNGSFFANLVLQVRKLSSFYGMLSSIYLTFLLLETLLIVVEEFLATSLSRPASTQQFILMSHVFSVTLYPNSRDPEFTLIEERIYLSARIYI